MASSPPSLSSSYSHCRRLALAHYENFPVGRFGVPLRLRRHIHAIYAFARVADDFADEPRHEGRRLERLEEWEAKLGGCLDHADDPVFVALAHTIRKLALPRNLFTDLLSAFKQDAVRRRYETWTEVLDYCRRSANPIGRLVLHVTGQDRIEILPLSDGLCTALQLANFWQDLSVDLPRGRCYLPREDAARFGVDPEALLRGEAPPGAGELLRLMFVRTIALFENARPLPGLLRGRLRWEIAATWLGGRAILDASSRLGEDALRVRPVLGLLDKLGIAFKAVRGRV